MCSAGSRSGSTFDGRCSDRCFTRRYSTRRPCCGCWSGIAREPVRPPADARGRAELGRPPPLARASTCSASASRVDGDDPARPAPDRGQAPVDVRDARDGSPDQPAGHRHQEGARRHPALRLHDAALWRHSGRAIGRRQGAARRWSRRASEAIATGRPVIIYPEGTRVRVGEAPPLAVGLRRALSSARPAGRPGRGRQRAPVGPRLRPPQRHGDVQGRRDDPRRA